MTQWADVVLFPLVKGRCDPSYRKYVAWKEGGILIDQRLPESVSEAEGIKYYRFDNI